MSPTLFQVATMAFAALSAACAVWVAVRAGRWRESDEAKALMKRMGDVEIRVTAIEKDILDLPTKADVARLEESLKAVRDLVTRTERGVERIEDYMMKEPRA